MIVLVIIALFLIRNLDGWLVNDDEGTFLYQVWRISEGGIPYQDIFTSRWPLFLYTGALWMRVFGPVVLSMRALTVAFTLGTAILVFLVAREITSLPAALMSMLVFAFNPQVFYYARFFQPEPFYVFWGMLGVWLFVLGCRRGQVGYFLAAGAAFVVATLYKLLGILFLGGCGLSLIVLWLRTPDQRKSLFQWALVMAVVYFGLLSTTVVVLTRIFPSFYDCVIGVNLAQGSDLTRGAIAIKGMIFLIRYFVEFSPFLLLALPALWRGWRGDKGLSLLVWILPTALSFMILGRTLFGRLLIYLVPSLSILVMVTLESIREMKDKGFLYFVILFALISPWAMEDLSLVLQQESDTLAMVEQIESLTDETDLVLSDYQELNFYAQRQSTYWGSEISYVITNGGVYRGSDLIAEIESLDVMLVIIDVNGNHMTQLQDYEQFFSYVSSHFELVDTYQRVGQVLEMYQRIP